ncbi:MAG: hypothetical protein IJI05_05305, partial [Erysipelotrichaceae bacterium]|nr:hypothetical protein [Erysipelotrichaceae bacterium]
MKLKVPFLKKKKNQVEEDDYLDLMDTTEETVTDYTVSDTDATISIDSLEDVTRTETAEYDEELDDDEEYEYARNSVLADKKARGEWVDLSSFGLATLDISI